MQRTWGVLAVSVMLTIPCVLTKDTNPELRNKVIYCGACLGLAMEMEWYVGTSDSEKKVEVGGFRIDSEGNIKTKTVPFKTSEINLFEIFEYICRRMTTYAESVDKKSGHVNYIPQESRDGHKISMNYARVSADIGNSLEFACDTILEEYEDAITEMLRNGTYEIGETLCVERSGLCKKSQYKSTRNAFLESLQNRSKNDIKSDIKKDVKAASESDDLAAKMEALRGQGMDIYTKDDIGKLINDLDAQVADPVSEDWDDDRDEL